MGLLAEPDFRRLWVADILSQVGTRLSLLAVPLLALYTLDASTFEVASLRAAGTLGALLVGLPAGAWVDRLRCRPILITADLGRALLLMYVAVGALVGWLTVAELLVAVFAVGLLTVFFDVGHHAYLPRLVAPSDLVEGNSRLAANHAIGAVSGAGAGGFLIQALTAPVALVVDAASYLWSAIWLRRIRRPEERPERSQGSRLRTEIADGLRFVRRDAVVRAVAAATAMTLFFQAAGDAVMIVFLVRDVGLGPAAIGLLSMVGLLGAIVTSMLTDRITKRWGEARVLLAATLWNGVAFALVAWTDTGWRLGVYVVAMVMVSGCIIILRILVTTAWQFRSPERLRGRVGATMEFVAMGALPIGSLSGGVLGSVVGLRPTLVIAGIGMGLSAVWLFLSPLRGPRDLPRS